MTDDEVSPGVAASVDDVSRETSEPCPDCLGNQRRLLMTGAVCGLAIGLALGMFVLSRGDG